MAGVYFGSFLPAKGLGLGLGEKGLGRPRSPGVLAAGTGVGGDEPGPDPARGVSLEARAERGHPEPARSHLAAAGALLFPLS